MSEITNELKRAWKDKGSKALREYIENLRQRSHPGRREFVSERDAFYAGWLAAMGTK